MVWVVMMSVNWHKKKKVKQEGFTLIELMIAMMLGLIVIGGALSIYISTIKSSSDVVNSARLNYDLDSVMQLMVNDIRRAGYWGGAIVNSNAVSNPNTCDEGNPFSCGIGDIIISNKTGEAVNSCVLYTYDADDSGALTPLDVTDDVNLSEYYGFRINGDGIDVRSSVPSTANVDCDSSPGWEKIVDTGQVQISTLSFTIANYKCLNAAEEPYLNSCAAAFGAAVGAVGKVSSGETATEIRQINITLTGNVINDAPVLKTLQNSVKVRNNRIFTQP